MEENHMFEEKESIWRKKGFYVSVCTLLLGILAVGTISYRQSHRPQENNLMAGIATEVPEATTRPTDAGEQQLAQTNAQAAKNTFTEKEAATESPEATPKKKKRRKDRTASKTVTPVQTPKAVSANTNVIQHSFDEERGLLWPVKGDVVLKYSMNNTIYFKTLAQYRCNPGVVIAAEEGTKVKSAADCRVLKIEQSDELGTVVTTEIGNDYTITYGQLDNLSVNKGDELKEGDVIGTVAKPTKYYTEEGSNLYFQVNEGEETVDPMLLLR